MAEDTVDRLAALELASAAQKAALRALVATLVETGALEPDGWNGTLEEIAADLSEKEPIVDRKVSIVENVRAFETSVRPTQPEAGEDAPVQDEASPT